VVGLQVVEDVGSGDCGQLRDAHCDAASGYFHCVLVRVDQSD